MNEFVVKNGLIVSGSTNVSGSVTAFSFTGSFTGSFSGSGTVASASFATSASYALSASFATSASRAVSSSYALSASFAQQASSASTAISSSYALSASFAVSASRAVSSSYALQATSASYVSGTIVSPGSTTQILFNSGGLAGTDPNFVYSSSRFGVNISNPYATAHITQFDPSLPALPAGYQFLVSNQGEYITDNSGNYVVGVDPVNYASASFIVDSLPYTNVIFVTGSSVGINTGLPNSGSLHVNGNVYASSFTGSLSGTATNAVSSSYALSSSYAENATNAVNATSASHALNADNAISSSYISGTIAAPGSNTYVTYNSGGVLGADSNFTYSGSKVGIGNSAPLASLHILENSSPYSNIPTGVTFLLDNNGDYLLAGPNQPFLVQDPIDYTGTAFKVDSLTGNLNVLFVSESKVGINKAAPNASLDVNGDAIISGSLTVSGSSTFRNIGPAEFTGSVTISGSQTNIIGNISQNDGTLSIFDNNTGDGRITLGGMNIIGNIGTNNITINYGNAGFSYQVTYDGFTGRVNFPYGINATGSTNITGSLNVTGPITNNGVNIQALSIAYAVALG
jgi:hypothetical protein